MEMEKVKRRGGSTHTNVIEKEKQKNFTNEEESVTLSNGKMREAKIVIKCARIGRAQTNVTYNHVHTHTIANIYISV